MHTHASVRMLIPKPSTAKFPTAISKLCPNCTDGFGARLDSCPIGYSAGPLISYTARLARRLCSGEFWSLCPMFVMATGDTLVQGCGLGAMLSNLVPHQGLIFHDSRR